MISIEPSNPILIIKAPPFKPYTLHPFWLVLARLAIDTLPRTSASAGEASTMGQTQLGAVVWGFRGLGCRDLVIFGFLGFRVRDVCII